MLQKMQRLVTRGLSDAQGILTYAKFGVPGALVLGWMAWPALTDDFKENTFGIKTPKLENKVMMNKPGSDNAPNTLTGKYHYTKAAVGERPTLAV